MDTQLFVWARKITTADPRLIISADHTWVTNYPNPGSPNGFTFPIPEGKNYWYCWGDFHNGGDANQSPAPFTAFSGPWAADLEQALCICKPNVAKDETAWPHSWIEGFYGVHGVCHQVANRVLWSAGLHSEARVTVRGVGGWQLSWFLYGPYGYPLQPGMWPLNKCEKERDRLKIEPVLSPESITNELIDSTLGDNVPPDQKEAIHKVRSDMLKEMESLNKQLSNKDVIGEAFAHAVNALLSRSLKLVAPLLTRAQFVRLFDIEPHPDLQVQLIDPRIAAKYIVFSRSAGA